MPPVKQSCYSFIFFWMHPAMHQLCSSSGIPSSFLSSSFHTLSTTLCCPLTLSWLLHFFCLCRLGWSQVVLYMCYHTLMRLCHCLRSALAILEICCHASATNLNWITLNLYWDWDEGHERLSVWLLRQLSSTSCKSTLTWKSTWAHAHSRNQFWWQWYNFYY